MGVIVGCMAETHVGVGAAAALTTVVDSQAPRDPLTHDLDGGLSLTRSPVRAGVTYDGQRVTLDTSPGARIVALADIQ
jgi:L-alanine-DL-glutamate epimerase-like enolase superfamily enzyme